MRFFRLLGVTLALALGLLAITQQRALGQETTGGLQGTVKDPSGAVVAKAKITATAPTLVGEKSTTSDGAGYYRFANLPPGTYALTIEAAGFETLKKTGLVIQVGHLPTQDITLQLGAVTSVVQVSEDAGPMIDETTTTTLTNISEQALTNLPHGTTYQSAIQFAPAARNEPLQGATPVEGGNGTGGTSPGNGSSGSSNGYAIGGGSDAENSYLVEGQETANIIGGYSHTTVPMDFIQEMQMKTSGVEAEFGGALGGVINVIMQKGTGTWHGSVYSSYQNGAMNGSPRAFARYNPASTGALTSWGAVDPTYQNLQPVRPHTGDFFPGMQVGGPLADILPKFWAIPDSVYKKVRERVFLYAAFNPEFNTYEMSVNYGQYGGVLPFSQNTQTYYGYSRIDAELTSKVRVFASWLYQGQKQTGTSLPASDSVGGFYNVTSDCATSGSSLSCGGHYITPTAYTHGLTYRAPATTFNTGADITITNSLVSTTRFGYFFENYTDNGYPLTTTDYQFYASGAGGVDANGNPLPSVLQNATGWVNQPINQNYTHVNADKAVQFDQDIAWFHSGKGGTHNVKFGYQLHRNSNNIYQNYNSPEVEIYPGVGATALNYSAASTSGGTNCAKLEGITGLAGDCVGTYGMVNINDFGTRGQATGVNHSFFVQDAWTVGKGLTLNYGIRMEHEYLPAENQPSGTKITKPIDFSWGDKVAPRIGAAWSPFRGDKAKLFGGYGEYFDQMKLNVAISSYGGQYWNECWYGLMAPTFTGITMSPDANARYCQGSDPTVGARVTSTNGLYFIENINQRAFPTTCPTCSPTEEGTAPGLKPFSQHDSYLGVDYQIRPTLALEARWDRRRLDHAIEDAAIFNPATGGETFVIVNPGQGVNATYDKFYNFLYGANITSCTGAVTCPIQQNPQAARSYDALEFRLTKDPSHNWAGMFSYTYSNFRGNYTGLTSSDLGDGGGGRNSPNNSRAFDEPFFQFSALGTTSNGLLPTDRPNALKGYVFYELSWLKKFTTDLGINQIAYSGTPQTSYLDVGYAFPGGFPTDIVRRGQWIDVNQSASTGAITASAPYTKRTPWFTQSDFNLKQNYKLSDAKTISFDATFTNLLNQHSVIAYWSAIDSQYLTNFIAPGGYWLVDGSPFYGAAEHKYDYLSEMNAAFSNGGGPLTIDSRYGKPYFYQTSRNIRLAIHFTF